MREPVHVVYGGAHLFQSDTARKLGGLALKSLERFAPDGKAFGVSDRVYARVVEKLRTEPVEDLRIDFEDGYGYRSDAEEDGHAVAAATNVAAGFAAGTLPPFIGIRIKPFNAECEARSVRTLRLFLTTLLERTGGVLPPNFVVTYPKATATEQVSALASLLDVMQTSLMQTSVKIELMIETPESIAILLPLAQAARGRCVAAHFGAYDYTAALGITAAHQHLLHPACDFARNFMQVAYAGSGVRLSDGATNVLPVGNDASQVHRAWKLHFDHIRHSLACGFYQSWDLHPAQLPVRYAAVYSFFLEGLDDAGERLRNFINKAAQATMVGSVFDDAATGQGLLNYFVRAMNCGAITTAEACEKSSLTLDELHSGSFLQILNGRRA